MKRLATELGIRCPKCNGPWVASALRVKHFSRCDSREPMRPAKQSLAWPLIVDLVARAVTP